jgi:hypothetical protein
MATTTKYPKVPQAKISSVPIVSFDAGLDQRGKFNIKSNAFAVGQNVRVDAQGLATFRLAQKRWLPDVVGTAYQVFPAIWDGSVYYFTADNGKIKFCMEGSTSWTNCGGDNTITTGTGIPNTFERFENKITITNGEDKLGYIDLTSPTFDVVHFAHVNNPASAPTAVLTVLTTGSYKVYYCIAYNSVVGKTSSSPILTQSVNKIREQWSTAGTEFVTLTDPNTRPSGAVSWNVYLATAPAGGTIQLSDMLPIALGLDINTTTFVDNGSITQITNAGTAPTSNTTDGPIAKHIVNLDGRPFIYGIKDDDYAVLIGGNTGHALDFGEQNGGYKLVLNEGSNYYPKSIVGFRNGQGIPSVTVMFSNTEGLSKQSIVEQSTVSLGTFSAVVWTSTEQNYGAAGVASPYGTVNYRGLLTMFTTDGITAMDTSANAQNVLTVTRISDPVVDEISSIRGSLLGQVVGTAWSNQIIYSVPARGFVDNNLLLFYDVTRKGNECWYTSEISSQWVGTIAPQNDSGFVYISQDNHFFKLIPSYVAQDELADGTNQPFPSVVQSGVIGTNTAHDGFYAVVQVVFYLLDFVGTANLTITWRDYQTGKMKSKTRSVTNGAWSAASSGWGSSGYQFNDHVKTKVLRWGEVDIINDTPSAQKADIRKRIQLNNVVTNELQGTVAIAADNSAYRANKISFEGQPLGISPDIRG